MKTWIAQLPSPLPEMARRLYRLVRGLGPVVAATAPADGKPAIRYRLADWPAATALGESWVIELHVRAGQVSRAEAEAFVRRQDLAELRLVGWQDDGARAWELGAPAGPVFFFLAPERLPRAPAAWAASLVLLASAEEVDVVVLADRGAGLPPPSAAADVLREPWRGRAAFAGDAFAFDPRSFGVAPKKESWLVNFLADSPPMGEYLASRDPGAELAVGVRPASRLRRRERPAAAPGRQVLLVTVPFFARGGVEHTLFETLRHLLDRFEPIFVSLAPHAPELGDRRADFEELGPQLFSLGDWLHPAAMPEVLEQLILAESPFAWYNANGTTLFYELAPRLKARFPGLRVLDHLYDHRVGYIEWYRRDLLAAIDACVAENATIAATLASDYGWPIERAPVVWGCGRRDQDWPPAVRWEALRAAKRAELGLGAELKVILVAARMHPQKRPLDLPLVAARVRDLPLHFLIVGGGPLENEVDAAIAAAREQGAAITRLPFRTDIPELILAADAGCLVSDYEGLPIFLLECLQAGRPFLGTDVGALGDVLRETGAGWVVEKPGDLAGLEAALRQLADAGEYERRADAARAAGPRFGVGPCAAGYAEVFLGTALPEQAPR